MCCLRSPRNVSRTANARANMPDESPGLQKSSNVPALASWYMVGWVVPALLSSLAGAIQWNNQRPLYPLYVLYSH